MKVVNKPWGDEIWWAVAENAYLAKTISIDSGHRLSLHYHVKKIETMMVVSGFGTADIGETVESLKEIPLFPGKVIHVPPGYPHRISCAEGGRDLLLTEVSTYHPDDVVRLDDDYQRGSSAEIGSRLGSV